MGEGKGYVGPPPLKLLGGGGLAPLPPSPLSTPMLLQQCSPRCFDSNQAGRGWALCRALPFLGLMKLHVPSTLVISKSKGPSETLRDIRTSTYQISRIEENTDGTTKFHK